MAHRAALIQSLREQQSNFIRLRVFKKKKKRKKERKVKWKACAVQFTCQSCKMQWLLLISAH